MKTLFVFLLLAISAQAEIRDIMAGLWPDSIVENTQLDSNEVILHFNFQNVDFKNGGTVTYSIDVLEDVFKKGREELKLTTTAGYHNLQLFYNSEHFEIYTSVNVQGQKEYYYTVHFQNSERPVMTRKPVIYLYPEETIDVDVEVNISEGDNAFFYPFYNEGWTVTAAPDGELTIGEETFNYLFWEVDQSDHLASISDRKGFVVEGTNALAFLEEKLTKVGLTSTEKADFITYWGPILAQNDKNFVRFEWNDACDKFATLEISPKPDNIYRLYIFTTPIQANLPTTPQELPTFDRSGFTVIEWGGQVSNTKIDPSL